jgi:hypothetical protein
VIQVRKGQNRNGGFLSWISINEMELVVVLCRMEDVVPVFGHNMLWAFFY